MGKQLLFRGIEVISILVVMMDCIVQLFVEFAVNQVLLLESVKDLDNKRCIYVIVFYYRQLFVL